MKRSLPVLLAVIACVGIAVAVLGHGSNSAAGASNRQPPLQPVPPAVVATRFLTGLSLDVVEDPQRRNRHIERFADHETVATLEREYAAEANRIADGFSARPRVARTALMAYRLHPTAHDRVGVDVWAVSVGGAGASPVAVGWRVVRVGLVRRRSAWKVATVAERPAPDLGSTARDLARATAGYRSYRVAP